MTEDRAVGDAVDHLIDLSISHGVRLHPTFQVVERDGELSVTADLDGDRELISIPSELFVPVGEAEWEVHDDRMRLRVYDPQATAVHRQLVDAMVELYNVAAKLARARLSHPRLALLGDPQGTQAMQILDAGRCQLAVDPAEVFVSTRTYHHGAALLLLPLVDLLNHRRGAPPLNVTGGSLAIPISRSSDDPECFVSYGLHHDAVHLALQYGFLDRDVVHAHSVPMTIDVEDVGTVTIEGRHVVPTSGLDPPGIKMEPSGLTFSHMTFDPEHPQRLIIAVELALAGYAQHHGIALSTDVATPAVIRTVAESNLDRLEHAERLLASSERPAAAALRGAVRHQMDVVERSVEASLKVTGMLRSRTCFGPLESDTLRSAPRRG